MTQTPSFEKSYRMAEMFRTLLDLVDAIMLSNTHKIVLHVTELLYRCGCTEDQFIAFQREIQKSD